MRVRIRRFDGLGWTLAARRGPLLFIVGSGCGAIRRKGTFETESLNQRCRQPYR